MGLESFGFSLPWSWSLSNGASSTASDKHASSRAEKKSKKHPRTRAEQVAGNGSARYDSTKGSDDGYYPGLVNISGTYCFMNSTLQALASLHYLQPHIDAIHAKAEALDVPSPVIDALQTLFRNLNTPRSTYHALRPYELIEVLTSQSEGRTNSLLYSREHQDAQELFQLLSECIKNEIAAVDKEGYRDRGLGGLRKTSEEWNREIGKSVFDGLTANRRSCITCGYTEAVMHFAFDNWQLSVPRMAASCPLEWCLEDYTRLEILHDCVCRKCSMLATHRRLLSELRVLEETTRPEAKPSASRKRRFKDVCKMERQVRTSLEEGRIEDDLRNVRMDKVFSKASSKQAMIARPPPVLALHINRSIHYGHYAAKNPIQVIFPEVLDLTPYTTSGSLSTEPTHAISTPTPSLTNIPRSTTPTPATYAPRTIYRLSAVVCHFGQHSFGHYICYRRKPRSPDLPLDKRWSPPRLVDPLRMEDDSIDGAVPRYMWEDDEPRHGGGKGTGRGWLRISDDSVRECGIETVQQEGSGAFMLYYERALPPLSGIARGGDGNVSEETLKPEVRKMDWNLSVNGSVASLVSEVGVGVRHAVAVEAERKAIVNGAPPVSTSVGVGVGAPRIVRSVATGRKRSLSVSASDRGMSRSLRPSEEATPTSSSLPNDTFVHLRVNGSANTDDLPSMTASAPSLLPSKPVTSSLASSALHKDMSPSPASIPPPPSTPSTVPITTLPHTSSSTASSSSTSPSPSPPQQLSNRKAKQPLHPQGSRTTHTPKPQPPHPPAVVGLKA